MTVRDVTRAIVPDRAMSFEGIIMDGEQLGPHELLEVILPFVDRGVRMICNLVHIELRTPMLFVRGIGLPPEVERIVFEHLNVILP